MGRFDFMLERKIILMYHIVWKILISLSSFIIELMQNAMNQLKVSLPYGMVLTLVFLEHRIDLEGETTRALMHIDTYNDLSL